MEKSEELLEEHGAQNDFVFVHVRVLNVNLTESLIRGVVKGLSKSGEGNGKIVSLALKSYVKAITPKVGVG